MVEIKTITDHLSTRFDLEVNEALAEGWELVRRECFITGSDRATTFYAELERVVDEPEEEEDDPDATAFWAITRNPAKPYRCSNCGHLEDKPKPVCPNCIRVMEDTEV